MAVLRFLASLFALVAVVALVADATPALNGTGAFKPMPAIGYWKELAPSTLVAARAAIQQTPVPWVWDPILTSVLGLPAAVLFGGLAIVCGYFGRRRQQMKIHVN